jgi:carboxyl-terminal processing protease
MFLRFILFILLCLCQLADAKPPQLTPHDAKIKIDEILKAHVSYQQLTPKLIARSLVNYIEELDPHKTYFIESDIAEWISPTSELLERTLDGYYQEDFSTFRAIHATLLSAIERRHRLEKEFEQTSLPTGVQQSEFKDLKWAKSEAELSERLQRIMALRLETVDKIAEGSKEHLLQRLNKRRKNLEEELTATSPDERHQVVLSYFLKATSSSLDSQTMYFTPSEANQFMIQVQQRLFGIGAQLRDDLNGLTIVRLLEGGPALQGNKLKVNDRIIAVDKEPIAGLDITEAVEMIRGQQGTTVNLTILREVGESKQQETLDVELVRGEVVLKETRFETSYEPYGNGIIGVIKLFSFYQDAKTSSASDLAAAITALKQEHTLKGIVLDLRGNAGGLLQQAVAVTGLFIDKGVVVSIKDNNGQVQHLRNIDNKKIWDGPLLVLTNRLSASASEIVAQTLHDYGRAIVVGDTETFGKGTFQTFTLEASHYGKVNPKGEYKVTRGRYYTVSGKSPQLIGVKSDIIVPGIYSELEIGEKFSKFPVETDQIPPTFQDDLSDIPPFHRFQISRNYQQHLQPVLNVYEPYVDALSKNSSLRLSQNKNYQNFITFTKEIAKKDSSAEPPENFGQNDLQLIETMNIMKDLIFYLEKNLAFTTPLAK